VATELTRVTGLPVSVGPGGAVTLALDPSVLDEDAIAIANWTFRGATIISGRVRFVRRSEIAGGARADWPNPCSTRWATSWASTIRRATAT
jgi:hypothetical protein